MSKIATFLLLATVVALVSFSYFFIDPNLFYLQDFYTGFSLTNRKITTLIFILLISLFYIAYMLFVNFAYRKTLLLDSFRKYLFLTLLVLFFSYPAMVSYDIFNYTTTSKILFGFTENPYIVMPVEFNGGDFLRYTHAANKTALYGPVWLLITGVPYMLFNSNFLVMLFGFKFIAAAFYLLVLILIWKNTKDLLSLVFFSLNPLVLFETFVGSHNDIVMMFFALFSFWLMRERKILYSGVSLLLSFLIKFATFFLIPLYIYVFWQKLQNKIINWEKVYLSAAFFMTLIFLLSPLREEIYPWYFIWVLVFVSLTKNLKLYLLTGFFSYFLLLRYVPYMFLGTHFGITPYVKIGITFGPLFVFAGILTYILMASKNKH